MAFCITLTITKQEVTPANPTSGNITVKALRFFVGSEDSPGGFVSSPNEGFYKDLEVGTDSDGNPETRESMWRIGQPASLVHDALCQYRHVVPISGVDIDRLFGEMLREESRFFGPVYYRIMRCYQKLFGTKPAGSPPIRSCRSFDGLRSE